MSSTSRSETRKLDVCMGVAQESGRIRPHKAGSWTDVDPPEPQNRAPSHQNAPMASVLVQIQTLWGRSRASLWAIPPSNLGPVFPSPPFGFLALERMIAQLRTTCICLGLLLRSRPIVAEPMEVHWERPVWAREKAFEWTHHFKRFLKTAGCKQRNPHIQSCCG